MTGLIDVGGGMKCAYSAGLYDYLMDNGIYFDYYLGVSAGSMNLLSYMAGEKGRNIAMYRESAKGDEYLSISNLVHTGAYMHYEKVGEDYFGAEGKNAFNYGKFFTSEKQFVVSATDAADGKTCYFTRRDMWDRTSLIQIICASCCIPVVSKPIEIDSNLYFDGGLAEPIPFRKAFDDGCDKIVVVLSAPIEQRKDKIPGTAILGNTLLREYPRISEVVEDRPAIYNYQMRCLKEYESEGKALIFSPEEIQGAFTLVKNEDVVNKLYENGQRDAKKNLAAIRKMLAK
ncbi:MAG: patatin family protein [Clostridia bacterium]|nr:patatin family protein [Clostridia bacterium]